MGAKTSTLGIGIFVACDLSTVTDALLPAFILSYIGMATAVGRSVEIPIILRSLTDSMAVLPEHELPLAIHPNFLATLDIGAYEEDNKCQVIKGYDLSWWTGQKPRDLDTVKILDQLSLASCITHYRQYFTLPHTF